MWVWDLLVGWAGRRESEDLSCNVTNERGPVVGDRCDLRIGY